MKTYEEIEAKRNELNIRMGIDGLTPEIRAEFDALCDAEAELEMKNAEAIAKGENVLIYIKGMYECGYAINTKINGEWDYHEYDAVDAMKKFCELAREHNVKTCLVNPDWLNVEYLKKLDADREAWRDEEEYADACMASCYGDDTLLNRYNRKHGIEKEYSPSNPWDAPGMSIHDFI